MSTATPTIQRATDHAYGHICGRLAATATLCAVIDADPLASDVEVISAVRRTLQQMQEEAQSHALLHEMREREGATA